MEDQPDIQEERIEAQRHIIKNLSDDWVESEHLKNVIVSLSSKIVTTTDLEKELNTYTETLRDNDAARARLRDQLGDASSQAQQRSNETQAREIELNSIIQGLRDNVDSLNGTVRDRDSTIHDREFTISQRDKEINALNLKLDDLKEMKAINDKYCDEINAAEEARVDLQNKFNKVLDDHKDRLDVERIEKRKLVDENTDLRNKLQQALREIEELKLQLADLNKLYDDRLLVLSEIKAQRDKLLIDLKEYQDSRDRLHKEIQALKVEFENIRKADQEHFDQMMVERTEIETTLRTRERRITELETNILEINTVVHKLRQQVDSLNSETHRLKDVETQLIKAKENNDIQTEDRVVLRKELEKASDFMVDLEEKVHTANSTSVTLLNKVKESEREVDILKDYIYELKSRVAIYIPVREDPIDKKLAEYINNYPDRSKFKIMFMRESSGVYLFGSRRIYVRVEKGKINIRVGGGYLTIDEFLDQYTPMELERIERKTVNTKMAVQRTLVGREVREESPIRTSPIRAKRKSPKKSPKKNL